MPSNFNDEWEVSDAIEQGFYAFNFNSCFQIWSNLVMKDSEKTIQLPAYKGFIPHPLEGRFRQEAANDVGKTPDKLKDWYVVLLTDYGLLLIESPPAVKIEGRRITLKWDVDSDKIDRRMLGRTVEMAVFTHRKKCFCLGLAEMNPRTVGKTVTIQLSITMEAANVVAMQNTAS
jgi:hypothetical protein